jgi:hypothetical protein
MMAGTQVMRTSRVPPAGDRASEAMQQPGRGRRAARRLWTALHAQALMDNAIRGPEDVAFVEDDRRRLSRRSPGTPGT